MNQKKETLRVFKLIFQTGQLKKFTVVAHIEPYVEASKKMQNLVKREFGPRKPEWKQLIELLRGAA